MKRTPLTRQTPLTRTPMKRKKARAMKPEFRLAVIERDKTCRAAELWRDVDCSGGAHIHHVLMRSQGGKDTLDDCVLVCDRHHHEIHMHPERSYTLGLLRRRA